MQLALHPTHTADDIPLSTRHFWHNCDLSVSELLGCWSDNEFITELNQVIMRVFMKPDPYDVCLIPSSFTNYVVPMQSAHLARSIEICGKGWQRNYLAGAPSDARFLTEPKAVYSVDLTALTIEIKESSCLKGRVSFDGVDPLSVTAFFGYFTARLYGDLVIDTRQNSPTWNAYHWEAFVFPIQPVSSLDNVTSAASSTILEIRRHCQQQQQSSSSPQLQDEPELVMWYEWRVIGGPWSNAGGCHDCVRI